MKKDPKWFVYILHCNDDTLYTGITTNIPQRLHEHNHSPKGAKYTRGRTPVKLVYSETQESRSSACRREYFIKKLSRKQKEQLIQEINKSFTEELENNE